MARIDAVLKREALQEAETLGPLLRRKDRIWRAINGCVYTVVWMDGWMGSGPLFGFGRWCVVRWWWWMGAHTPISYVMRNDDTNRSASPIPGTEEERAEAAAVAAAVAASSSATTLRQKMAELDAARAAIHQVQDAAATRRAEVRQDIQIED